jgi:hypothetical protein
MTSHTTQAATHVCRSTKRSPYLDSALERYDGDDPFLLELKLLRRLGRTLSAQQNGLGGYLLKEHDRLREEASTPRS